MLLKEIKYLLQKEIMLEWRQKSSINGLLLYVASTVFVVYLSFRVIDHPATWNALFWIIMLFAATNAAGKSFSRESRSTGLYMYSLTSPQAVIISKIIYNILLMLLVSLITYLFYSLFIGNLVQDKSMFLVSLLLGSIGFASVLTLIAGIASKSSNNFTLMAILSFPVLLPFLITLIKISKNAIDGIDPSINYPYILILLLINMIVVILSYILFPYLWRD
ncbi:MAG: heme exporter protein CcmB [Bacteroidetes bacterium]|nr:heme exporter protein CcmB [Bacteroidota bacterium]